MDYSTNTIQIANFDLVDPDTYFICPYDPIHKIIAKRFPYHVMKCRKNWNGRTMLTCIFNARHIVPASEHRHHIANCPDRKCIEADIAYQQRVAGYHQSGHMSKGATALPSYEDRPENDEEDWDNEVTAEPEVAYNPNHYPGPPVVQNLTGYNAVQKREYHNENGTVNYKTQEDFNTHPHRPFPTDSDRSGNVNGPYGATNPPTTTIIPQAANEELYNYTPHRARSDNAAANHHEQQQSTASGFSEKQSGLRLPRQPARASAVTTGASNTAGGQKQKKGGRIAANIFNAGAAQPDSQQYNQAAPAVKPSFAAIAANNQPSNNVARPPPGFPTKPAAVGIGRGLVPPGVGRGFIPGIGRGIARGDAIPPGQSKK